MFKRIFDVVLSSFGLITLFPLFIVVAVWIKLDSRGSVFFRQERVGLNGKLFNIHKFRTMKIDSEYLGQLTVGVSDSRVTTSGRVLRKYKIDELAQLIDVFLGNMSLVGPRPEVPRFMDAYEPSIRKEILSVRPGITDKASIEMIDEDRILSKYSDPHEAYVKEIMPIKQGYYLDYVRSNSVFDDIRIIIQTIVRIIKY